MNRSQLQNRIAKLDKAEFEAFCAQFGVDGRALDGRTQAERAAELVTFMMRHGRLPEVAEAIPGQTQKPTLSQTAELEAALSWLDDIAAGKGKPVEEPPTFAWPSDLHDTPMEEALDTLAGLDTAVFEENVTMVWRDEVNTPRKSLPSANPYNISTPVLVDEMFFGRGEEIAFLQERLKGLQSTAVIGLRHMGKSSLLLHLCRHPLSDDFLMAFVDMRDGRFHTIDGLLNGILRQWERMVVAEVKQTERQTKRNYQALGRALLPNVSDVRQFAGRVRQLRQNGYHPVICLDEFEQMAVRPSIFDDAFYTVWQALAANEYLLFVTASTQPLAYLLKQAGLRPNFGTSFALLPLSLLPLPAAEQLLSEPAQQFGISVPQNSVNYMVDMCGLHPFFLQMGGFYLFDGLRLGQADLAIVGRSFRWQAEPYWEALWNSLSPRHQTMLAQPLPENPSLVMQRQVRALARLGLLAIDGVDVRPFSLGFAEWIAIHEMKEKETDPADEAGNDESEERSGLMGWLRGKLGGEE